MLLEFLAPLIEDYKYGNNRRNDNSDEVLYHREIGFPKDIRFPNGFTPEVRLKYGSHSREAALTDRYGNITLPRSVDVRKGDMFEIGVTGNVITKLAVRFAYDQQHDLTIVINTRDGFVKTVWLNDKGDTHRTLNHSKYVDPNKSAQRPQLRH